MPRVLGKHIGQVLPFGRNTRREQELNRTHQKKAIMVLSRPEPHWIAFQTVGDHLEKYSWKFIKEATMPAIHLF